MDIQNYKKLSKPKIISGKMIKLVLNTRKQRERDRFRNLEQQREQMQPLFKKLDELKESFDKISKSNERIPEKPAVLKQELDFDQGFTAEEIELLQYQGLDAPSTIIEEERNNEALNLINKLNNKLGQEKKRARRRFGYNELEKYSKVNRKLRDRLKMIDDLQTSQKKIGRGLARIHQPKVSPPIFTSPDDLLSRFELLGGSLLAGNNSTSVKKEFSKIAHKLRDLQLLNNRQLLTIAKRFGLQQ